MDSYKIEWKHSAIKELKKLDKPTIKRIITVVDSLTTNPIPKNCRKLKGTTSIYRIRVGNYRIIYSLRSHKLIIEIIRVGHRKDIYRKLT